MWLGLAYQGKRFQVSIVLHYKYTKCVKDYNKIYAKVKYVFLSYLVHIFTS